MATPVVQPAPFEIVEHDGGARTASNGRVRVCLPDARGTLFRRRGIRGLAQRPVAELVLPQLNALAGDILARPDMPAADLAGRLAALACMAAPQEPQRVEWCVAQLEGVRVYTDGESIVVTTEDLAV